MASRLGENATSSQNDVYDMVITEADPEGLSVSPIESPKQKFDFSPKWLKELSAAKKMLLEARRISDVFRQRQTAYEKCLVHLRNLRSLAIQPLPYQWNKPYIAAFDSWITSIESELVKESEKNRRKNPIQEPLFRKGVPLEKERQMKSYS